jgi:hypothetical protein
VPPAKFNRIVWRGTMGGKPYPAVRTLHKARGPRAVAENRADD